jgi:uncharacterized membrane-anchored protein YitT (DUF2179 family)
MIRTVYSPGLFDGKVCLVTGGISMSPAVSFVLMHGCSKGGTGIGLRTAKELVMLPVCLDIDIFMMD